jgi:Domain of unknown function (DUF4124)
VNVGLVQGSTASQVLEPDEVVAWKVRQTHGQRPSRTCDNMKQTIGMIIAALALAAPASAQTMYRCLDLGRTIYSDKPCLNGEEIKQISANGNPTAQTLERSRMKARMDEQRAITAANAARRDAENGKAAKCVKGATAPGCEP